MSNLVEFSLGELLEAAEAEGWEVEVIQNHFPEKEEVILNNQGELEPLYVLSYCNTTLTINTGEKEPIVFYQSYIKEIGPGYWVFHTHTTDTVDHRNILTLQRLGIPYSTV